MAYRTDSMIDKLESLIVIHYYQPSSSCGIANLRGEKNIESLRGIIRQLLTVIGGKSSGKPSLYSL